MVGSLNFNPGTYVSGGYSSSRDYGYGCGCGYGYSYNTQRVTQTDISDLIRYIETGNAEQVMQKYNQLNISGDSTTRNRIETYFRRYYGQDLTTTLEQTAGSSFASGLVQGIPIFGLFDDGLSGKEVEAMITGIDETPASKFAEGLGGALSGAASGAAIGSFFGFPVGTIVGAVAGLAMGVGTVIAKDQKNSQVASKV